MKLLHQKGVKIVILSSTDFSSQGHLVCLASQKTDEGYDQARIEFPGLPTHFVGTGDLFTALTTAWLQHDQFDIKSALEKTIATMQSVLNRTLKYAKSKGGEKPSPHQLELKLIQSREDILHPQVKIKAEKL